MASLQRLLNDGFASARVIFSLDACSSAPLRVLLLRFFLSMNSKNYIMSLAYSQSMSTTTAQALGRRPARSTDVIWSSTSLAFAQPSSLRASPSMCMSTSHSIDLSRLDFSTPQRRQFVHASKIRLTRSTSQCTPCSQASAELFARRYLSLSRRARREVRQGSVPQGSWGVRGQGR